MAQHQIRMVAAADHDAWLPLWRGYQTFYKVDIDAGTTTETWRRLLDDAEPMHAALLLDDAGRAVGLVQWLYHRTTWSTRDYCYLQDLFVAPESRRGGVGTALIRFVYEHARQQNAARVYWHTHQTNETGISVYRKVADESGFIQFRHVL